MMQYNFVGEPFPTIEEQQIPKSFWIEKLGPFADEFDEKDGIVTFDYSFPDTDNRRISFVFEREQHSLSDFIIRFNNYIKETYGDTE